MAEMHGSTQATETPRAQATPSQESRNAEQWRDQARDLGNEMRQKTQELTAEGKAVATEYYEQGRERVLAWQQQLENQVREKPLQTLLMAAGIGLLVGLLKRR